MGFFKTALSLIGWIFLCLTIMNIPAFHKFTSRAILVLIPGFILGTTVVLFPERIWLSVLVWMAIMVLVIVPLTLLPRIKCAGIFMVTFPCAYTVMRLVVDKIIPLLFKNFQKTVWTTVIVWGVALLSTLLFLIITKEDITFPELKRRWVKILDRVIASVIAAVSLLIPMMLYSDNLLHFGLATAVGTVVLYFFDVLAFDWFVRTDFDPPPTEEEREAMRRREERREKRRNSLPAKVARGAGKGVLGVAKLSLGVLHVGGAVFAGVTTLMGLDGSNPIPHPNDIIDPYTKMEQDYNNYYRPEEERQEAARIQRETEAAIKYYNENYQ